MSVLAMEQGQGHRVRVTEDSKTMFLTPLLRDP